MTSPEITDAMVEAAEAVFYKTQGDMRAALSAASPFMGAAGVGKIDDTEIRDLFDRMERELKLLREAKGRRDPQPGSATEARESCDGFDCTYRYYYYRPLAARPQPGGRDE